MNKRGLWMRGPRVGLVVLVLAVAAVSAAAAAGGGVARPQVQTLATFRGPVEQFAQSRRYLAWLTPTRSPYGPSPGYRIPPGQINSCGVVSTFLELRTGTRMTARGDGDDNQFGGCGGGPDWMALAGRRVYWQESGGSNATFFEDLVTEAAGQTQSSYIDYESVSNSGPTTDTIVAVSSDGTSVYAQSSPSDTTPGPIRRWVGSRSRRVSKTIPWLSALAAGQGRFAFATLDGDCAGAPAWSAANGEIAFSRAGNPYYSRANTDAGCPGGIWVMNSDGTGLRQIAAVGANPDWSRDGSKIAFDNRTEVIVANADGSSPQTLFPGKDPAWSPDGSRLAFDRDGALYVANSDGSGVRQLSATGLAPTWSPDGKQIAFRRPFGKGQGLGIINADGTGYRSLTTGPDAAPAWSPNGRLIAYARSYELRVVAPDGTGQRLLTSSNFRTAPAWSLDSQQILVAEQDGLGDTHLASAQLGSSSIPDKYWKTLTEPPSTSSVVLESHQGTTLRQFQVAGRVTALAVSKTTLAAVIVDHSRSHIQIFLPHPRTVALARQPSDDFSYEGSAPLPTSGNTIIFHVRHAIYALNARHGMPHLIAHPASRPIGLSIVGQRVAWAENGKPARIRAITLP